MSRVFKPIVGEQDRVVLGKSIGAGGFGTSFEANVYHKGKLRRKAVAKLFTLNGFHVLQRNNEEVQQRLNGHIEWFKRIAQMQKEYPLLVFNNQQIVPLDQIEAPADVLGDAYGTHAILSEGYKEKQVSGRKLITERSITLPFDVIEAAHLDEAQRFVLDQLKLGVLIHRDVFGVVTSGKRARLVVRDSDAPASLFSGNRVDDEKLHLLAAVTLNHLIKYRPVSERSEARDKLEAQLRSQVHPVYCADMIEILRAMSPSKKLGEIILRSR